MRSRYRTLCKECGRTIRIGDSIEKRNGNWVHEECPNRSSGSSTHRNAPATAETLERLVASTSEEVLETPSMKEFKPSVYQQAIFDFFTGSTDNGVVEAVAGSGKTTTLVKLLDLVPEGTRAIFLAFNKHIATELKSRVPAHIEVSTVHAQGYRMCRKLESLNHRDAVDEDKVSLILDDVWPVAKSVIQDSKTRAENFAKRAVARRLVSLAKATLFDYEDPAVVMENAERYGIELNGDSYEIVSKLPALMQACLERDDIIDYDDMVWFPVVNDRLKRNVDQYEFVMVDEAQDLNASQIAFILSMVAKGGRIIAVGDRNQSLYGFRGADVEAIPRLIEMLNARTLPLSISYRCPAEHVKLAKKLVPQIEASATAKNGTITEVEYKDLVPQLVVGDMVICRTNAPLIKPAFATIRSGKKAIIRGKDIGKNIVAFIERFDTDDLGTLEVLMSEYTEKEMQRLLDKGKELQAAMLLDKMETVLMVAKECKSVPDLVTKLVTLFDDRNEGIVFSSIHRAKGLESDRVFILRPELMPHPKAKQGWEMEQERNCQYVAFTRSKDLLCFVKGEE